MTRRPSLGPQEPEGAGAACRGAPPAVRVLTPGSARNPQLPEGIGGPIRASDQATSVGSACTGARPDGLGESDDARRMLSNSPG